jgi:hypothetical protein
MPQSWLTSWDDARRHKGRARVFVFVGAWVISVTVALALRGSALGDVLVSVAFATVVALLVTLTLEPVLRQETHGPSTTLSLKSRIIGGVAGGLVLALGTRVSQKPQPASSVWDSSSSA